MGIWGITSNFRWLENMLGGMRSRAKKVVRSPLQIPNYGRTVPMLCLVLPTISKFQQELR